MKYIFRILSLPLFMGTMIIIGIRQFFKYSWLFLKNGGEAVIFTDDDRATLRELLDNQKKG